MSNRSKPAVPAPAEVRPLIERDPKNIRLNSPKKAPANVRPLIEQLRNVEARLADVIDAENRAHAIAAAAEAEAVAIEAERTDLERQVARLAMAAVGREPGEHIENRIVLVIGPRAFLIKHGEDPNPWDCASVPDAEFFVLE